MLPARGVRKQYACDFLISDYVLARGRPDRCTDKGNNGPGFYRDGDRPGDTGSRARLPPLRNTATAS